MNSTVPRCSDSRRRSSFIPDASAGLRANVAIGVANAANGEALPHAGEKAMLLIMVFAGIMGLLVAAVSRLQSVSGEPCRDPPWEEPPGSSRRIRMRDRLPSLQ